MKDLNIQKLLNFVINMVKKSIGTQLAIYGIMIGILIALSQLNIDFEIGLLNIIFHIPKIYFFSLILTLLLPMGFLIYFEFFHKEDDYDITPYKNVANSCWHLFALAVFFLILAVVWDLLYLSLRLLGSVYPSLILSSFIIFLILIKIDKYFKKKKINFYDFLKYVRER